MFSGVTRLGHNKHKQLLDASFSPRSTHCSMPSLFNPPTSLLLSAFSAGWPKPCRSAPPRSDHNSQPSQFGAAGARATFGNFFYHTQSRPSTELALLCQHERSSLIQFRDLCKQLQLCISHIYLASSSSTSLYYGQLVAPEGSGFAPWRFSGVGAEELAVFGVHLHVMRKLPHKDRSSACAFHGWL